MEIQTLKEKLNNDLEAVGIIYHKSRQSLEIYKYFSKRHNLSAPLYTHINYLAFSDLIVGLAKMYYHTQSQHYRINGLLGKLKVGGEYEQIQFDDKENLILKWEKTIIENNDVINHIKLLRNKVFAHTDNYQDDYIDSIRSYTFSTNIPKFETLFDLVKNIIFTLKAKVFDEHHLLDLDVTEDKISIIEDYSNYVKLQYEMFNLKDG